MSREFLVCKNYRCKQCRFEGETYGYIKGDEFLMDTFDPCEECGSLDLDFLLSVPAIEDTERYPYFDRGLGITLESKEHRKRECKKRGVVAIDGDIDFSDDYGKLERKNAEADKIVADMQDRIDHHPGYAEYRKKKDQGWKPKHVHRDQGIAPGVDPFNEG